MKGYGPASRLELRLIMLRAFFRKDRNKMLAANAVLYIVGLGMVAMVVVPR